jgi:hypothetical protein
MTIYSQLEWNNKEKNLNGQMKKGMQHEEFPVLLSPKHA